MEEIKKTQNYEKFKLCGWNREIKENVLKRLDKSVQKEGWLVHPITVNENMEIIDGQHRFVYARNHNLPVYYIIVKGLKMEDCVVMNNARSAWALEDYINYYATNGNDNYVILRNVVDKYRFIAVSTLCSIIAGAGGTSGRISNEIKEGRFKLTTAEYKKAVEKLDFLEKCANRLYRIPGRPSALITAVAFAYDCPGVDKDRLLKRIENDISIITPPANLDMALKAIEELYNYRISRDGYVYIYTEYKKNVLKKLAKKQGGEIHD